METFNQSDKKATQDGLPVFNNLSYTNDLAELLTSPELEKSYLIDKDKRLEGFITAINFANEIRETDCGVKERPSIMRRDSGLASITQTSLKQNST